MDHWPNRSVEPGVVSGTPHRLLVRTIRATSHLRWWPCFVCLDGLGPDWRQAADGVEAETRKHGCEDFRRVTQCVDAGAKARNKGA